MKFARPRFKLATLLLLLTLLCIWLGVQVNRARTQHKVVEWVMQNGGDVHYDHMYEWTASDDDSFDTYEYYADSNIVSIAGKDGKIEILKN